MKIIKKIDKVIVHYDNNALDYVFCPKKCIKALKKSGYKLSPVKEAEIWDIILEKSAIEISTDTWTVATLQAFDTCFWGKLANLIEDGGFHDLIVSKGRIPKDDFVKKYIIIDEST